MIVLNLIIRPFQTINSLINEKISIRNLLIGILGSYIFALNDYIQVSLGWVTNRDYPTRELFFILINFTVCYFCSAAILFIVCKLFKGSGKLINITCDIGLSYIPLFLILPISLINLLYEYFRDHEVIVIITMVIFIILGLFTLIWISILAVAVISKSMMLSRKRAILALILWSIFSYVLYKVLL